jgi:hypothetical protein
MHEQSGVLRPVIEKYLNGKILDAEEIGIMRAYLLQWILSPAWSRESPRGREIPRGVVDAARNRAEARNAG